MKKEDKTKVIFHIKHYKQSLVWKSTNYILTTNHYLLYFLTFCLSDALVSAGFVLLNDKAMEQNDIKKRRGMFT